MATPALIDAPCEADGHPSACSEPAAGAVESTDDALLSVEGADVADHATAVMHFADHGHSTDPMGNCVDYQTHDLTPDQEHILMVNGAPVMCVDDSTTDPGSGGTAMLTDHGGNQLLSVTEQ
ncbi:hypothetical protein SAMN05192561_11269 [Halopenitus malekzadehii]|uniref:Uncharacterized protein n=1 Tax=Halopenitus malekzadehii TaxID=1267564 RepID=A0A1H6JP68_9EURY|nr:hypothetical protein [Halopenitus malekzadehii]SEH61091.1 hypothetical protein SAMN05192561_11269 [Halopenitus malekzadehii]